MLEIPRVVAAMDDWIQSERNETHHIVNSGMHGIIEAHKHPELKTVFNSVELFAPDGILMVCVARLRGFHIRKRHTGPGLLTEFARVAHDKGYGCYFYGDEESTLKALISKLKSQFPNMRSTGFHSPPFRPLTIEEDEEVIREINEAAPDVLWVGLGMPKQEMWIAEHRDRLKVPVIVGAGAAFKLTSGTLRRAPAWLRNLGFEWLWRLLHEPKSMWRRVFLDAPRFIGLVALELTGLRKFS